MTWIFFGTIFFFKCQAWMIGIFPSNDHSKMWFHDGLQMIFAIFWVASFEVEMAMSPGSKRGDAEPKMRRRANFFCCFNWKIQNMVSVSFFEEICKLLCVYVFLFRFCYSYIIYIVIYIYIYQLYIWFLLVILVRLFVFVGCILSHITLICWTLEIEGFGLFKKSRFDPTETVDGRNPSPPGMYKTLEILG